MQYPIARHTHSQPRNPLLPSALLCCSAPIVASQLLLVDEVLRAGMNM